jgi:hypothetical protein
MCQKTIAERGFPYELFEYHCAQIPKNGFFFFVGVFMMFMAFLLSLNVDECRTSEVS